MSLTKGDLSVITEMLKAAMQAPAIQEIAPANVAGVVEAAPAFIPAKKIAYKRELTPAMVKSVTSFIRQNPSPASWTWTANKDAKAIFARIETAILKAPQSPDESDRQYGERVILPLLVVPKGIDPVSHFGNTLNAFVKSARKMENDGTKPGPRIVKSGIHTVSKWTA